MEDAVRHSILAERVLHHSHILRQAQRFDGRLECWQAMHLSSIVWLQVHGVLLSCGSAHGCFEVKDVAYPILLSASSMYFSRLAYTNDSSFRSIWTAVAGELRHSTRCVSHYTQTNGGLKSMKTDAALNVGERSRHNFTRRQMQTQGKNPLARWPACPATHE